MLLVDNFTRSVSDSETKIDLDGTSQLELLKHAKFSLERNNLARAIQYTTLLKGESARVVSDWLKEARLTLETEQAAQALLAHAAEKNGHN